MTTVPSQSNQDVAEQLRNRAIDMYIAGLKPTEICRQLGRSRTWFYNTLARYQIGGRPALASQSRAPHTVHNRTPREVEAAIVRVRRAITSGEDPKLRYANIGADSIAIELEHAGVTPPSRSTINRILKQYDLMQPRPRRKQKPSCRTTIPGRVHNSQSDPPVRLCQPSDRRWLPLLRMQSVGPSPALAVPGSYSQQDSGSRVPVSRVGLAGGGLAECHVPGQ